MGRVEGGKMYLYLLAGLLCGLAVVVQGFMARLAFIEECGEKRREGAPASAGLGLIKFNVQNTFQKYHNQFIIEGGTFSIPFPLDQHVSAEISIYEGYPFKSPFSNMFYRKTSTHTLKNICMDARMDEVVGVAWHYLMTNAGLTYCPSPNKIYPIRSKAFSYSYQPNDNKYLKEGKTHNQMVDVAFLKNNIRVGCVRVGLKIAPDLP